MALPTGQISMSQVNVELGLSATAQISLNDAAVRTLAGVPSGAISMQNLQGKSNQFSFTISSNQTNANLRTLAINAGWNQTSRVVCTINSGIYISSNSTGTPALTINGSFPNGVELTNNGFIIGMGGAGGRGAGARADFNNAGVGGGGGLALSVSSAVSVRNNGTIGGGGGGGGGGSSNVEFAKIGNINYAGGGGGGGRSSAAANSSGGALGQTVGEYPTGAASQSGTVSSPGAGGGGQFNPGGGGAGTGGSGGGWGAAGGGGTNGVNYSILKSSAGGGGGGGAVSGNGNITWLAFGTRLGAIS